MSPPKSGEIPVSGKQISHRKDKEPIWTEIEYVYVQTEGAFIEEWEPWGGLCEWTGGLNLQ